MAGPFDSPLPGTTPDIDAGIGYVDKIAAFLATTGLTGACGAAFRRFLGRQSVFVPLAPGEALADRTAVADSAHFVYRGRLEVKPEPPAPHPGQAGERLGPGAAVGAFSLLGGGAAAVDAVALEPTLLLRIGLDVWRRGSRYFPQDMAAVTERAIREHQQSRLAAALRASRAFGTLDDALREALRAAMAIVVVPSGAYLLRVSDPGDSLYLVVNGRLEVEIADGGVTRVVAQVGPGDTVGEIGVILDLPRRASVRAVRDSTVARLHRSEMHALLQRHPVAINRALTASLAGHLIGGERTVRTAPKTIAVVPVRDGVPHAGVAAALAEAMAKTATVLVLDAAACERLVDMIGVARTSAQDPRTVTLIHMLSEAESRFDYILYVADPDLGNWTRRCLRQADQILLVAGADDPPAPTALEGQLAEELGPRKTAVRLILVHPRGRRTPAGTIRWLSARTAAAHHHLRLGEAADAARLARILTRRAVGLVLGGGGARGFAHAGVIRALQERAIPIDLVGGTSMGALIGAQCALQWEVDAIIERTIRLCRAGDRMTLPFVSLFSGKRFYRSLTELFGDATIEDLWQPYFAVSCNLSRASVAVLDRGRLRDAVMASNAPPGLLPPVVADHDLLIDGAFLNNVPVDVMAGRNDCGTIIAVDVEPNEDLHVDTPYHGGLSGWELLFRRLNPLADSPAVPNILDILTRLPSIGGLAQREKLRRGIADLYLQPPVGRFAIMAYKDGRAIAAVGHACATEQIDRWLADRGAL